MYFLLYETMHNENIYCPYIPMYDTYIIIFTMNNNMLFFFNL